VQCFPLILLALVALPCSAQDWNAVRNLRPGTEIRVSTTSRTVRGRVDSVTDSALTFKSGPAFDESDIRTVAVRQPGHRVRNVVVGLAVGAGAGLIAGLASRPKPNQLQVVSGGTVTAALTGAGALGGALIGALIPTGSWREIFKAP
jgi:hypothetical protein